jgi:hypothetical protein
MQMQSHFYLFSNTCGSFSCAFARPAPSCCFL